MKLYNLKRNISLWSIVTLLSAYPSFIIALSADALVTPMVIGVLIVMAGYIIATSSQFWQNIKLSKPYFARALKNAFIIRVVISIVFLLAQIIQESASRNDFNVFGIIDMYLGIGALAISGLFFNEEAKLAADFSAVLFTTLAQAMLVSLAVLLVAAIIWCIIRTYNFIKPVK